VTEPPAGTVKMPDELLKLKFELEMPAGSVRRFAPSKRYTLLKSESVETPMRLNARLVTETAALEPFVKVNFASSAIPWLFTKTLLLDGESEARETRRPMPTGTTGPGPGVTGPAVQRLFAFPRVRGPQYPAVGEMLFAAWNFDTAARVSPPKNEVSLPGEPAPLAATCAP